MNDPTPTHASNPKLVEIDSRQDRLLTELDQLNQRIEQALAGLLPATEA